MQTDLLWVALRSETITIWYNTIAGDDARHENPSRDNINFYVHSLSLIISIRNILDFIFFFFCLFSSFSHHCM